MKFGQGKSEDFKDILNFVLTILCELALVSQKMENKSFYFKWNGFKGFKKLYLHEYMNNPNDFEMSESFEHRVQIYTRMLLMHLIDKREKGITNDQIDMILKQCELENQQRNIEKIHSILKFLEFIIKDSPPTNPSHHIFTLVTKENSAFEIKKADQVVFKINKFLLDENLIKDNKYAEQFNVSFNEKILKKYTGINDDDKIEIDGDGEDKDININNLDNNYSSIKTLGKTEIKELDQFRVKINEFSAENEEVGFAVLKANNWCYYIKKLFCVIGRAPIKYGVPLKENNITTNYGNSTWNVDVDLGQNKKISKQHVLIAYNFQTCSFEIKNLSKKYPIKINGELLHYSEEMPLTSKSSIIIANQEFYFLLPI